MTQNRTDPVPKQTIFIVYAALVGTTFGYFGTLFVGVMAAAEPPPPPPLAIAMAVSAIGIAAASWFLPAKLHRTSLAALELEVEEVPDPNGSVMFRDQAPKIRVFADPARAESEARRVYFAPFLLRLALTQGVALFGFTLGMMGFSMAFVAPFFVLSGVLFALAVPRPARWREPVAERFDAGFGEG